MEIIYDKSEIDILKEKNKKYLRNSLLGLIVVVPLYVFFLIIAEENTEKLYTFLTILIWLSWGWIFLFILLYHILPNRVRFKHINKITSSLGTTITGDVIEIGNKITLERSLHIYEIIIKEDYPRHKVYFNIDLNECPFKVNDKVTVEIRNNFIYAYEILGSEVKEND